AWPPASVRPDPCGKTFSPVNRPITVASVPCTLGASGCTCQPQKSVPSYDRINFKFRMKFLSQRRTHGLHLFYFHSFYRVLHALHRDPSRPASSDILLSSRKELRWVAAASDVSPEQLNSDCAFFVPQADARGFLFLCMPLFSWR